MDCASLLADNLYYLFFYRATPAMKKTEGLRIRRSEHDSHTIGCQPATKKDEGLRGGMIATGMVFI